MVSYPEPKEKPRYISLMAAADMYSVNERTIRRMIADGDLTGYRFGKRLVRVDLVELDTFLRRIPTA